MYKQAMENTNQSLTFAQMPLISPIQKALEATGYIHPTPIQEQTIPLILSNHDLLGIAQTGTGKTAAFCLPIIQKLYQNSIKAKPFTPRVLILAPTRELALQIQENLKTYSAFSKLTSSVVFGGVSQVNQVKDLERGVDVVVATTGRLLDLIEQRFVNLNQIEILVLDEADRMLDMGFLPDINQLLKMIPNQRQSLFFSATMPKEVSALAAKILRDPKRVEVQPEIKTADKVEQFVVYVEKENKFNLLLNLLKDSKLNKVMLFVEMKHACDRVVERLLHAKISAAAIHSDKSQGARQRALEDFKNDKIRVLVATDIAARGIDIDNVSHVINYDLSHITENYIHRIGRTARAGAGGNSITFCTGEEKSFLYAIEKEIGTPIIVISNNPFYSEKAANAPVISVGKAKAILEAKRANNKNSNRKGGNRVAAKDRDYSGASGPHQQRQNKSAAKKGGLGKIRQGPKMKKRG
jgi:ATP-dependent RNA helicase RhlE